MRFLWALGVVFFIQFQATAKETDNLTGRYKSLQDSTEILNKEMNRRLDETAVAATKQGLSCSGEKSFRDMRILFHESNKATNMIGSLETWAEENQKVSKREARPANSVYEGVLSKGWLFNKLSLASTIKVNGELIGTDKLGHFIDQGFTYYTPYRQRGYKMDVALDSSLGSEKSAFGAASTGTVSYGDANANYHGILFYHALVEGSQPYLRCVNGTWSRVRDFDFANYVDAGWDEGINCSVIADTKASEIYEKNILKLETESKSRGREESYHCPVDPEACGRLRYRYVAYEKKLISPECRKVPMARSAPGTSGRPAGSSSGKGRATQ